MPRWASALVGRIINAYKMEHPQINWKEVRRYHTNGRAFLDEYIIDIYAGWDKIDAKIILVHEMAHLISQEGHNEVFWRTFWDMARKYHLPMERTKIRMEEYKKRATLYL